MASRTIHLGWAACLCLSTAVASSVHAEQSRPDQENHAKIKSAFILNFLRYTTWPADKFADESSPLVISVVGGTDVIEPLREIVRDVTILGRPVEVRESIYPPATQDSEELQAQVQRFTEDLLRSHLVFASGDQDQTDRVLVLLRSHDVLSVGDAKGFAKAGGMLELRRRGNRIVFDANLDSIKSTRIEISSKVLKLAESVTGRGRP